MKSALRCRMKSYIQPFERVLALKELSTLTHNEPKTLPSLDVYPVDYEVSTTARPRELLDRLAYWESVQAQKQSTYTTQALREATANIIKNGVPFDIIKRYVPFGSAVPLPNRRCLRYGTHGIHEYRGKFFPQLVRALLNIADVPRRGIVADPMCGSGTTLVEGVLTGLTAIGVDMNPLSVFMTRTKCRLLSLDAGEAEKAYNRIRDSLLSPSFGRKCEALTYYNQMPEPDRRYLSSWFSPQSLRDLDGIASLISKERVSPIQDLCLLVLSNILRRVSWQKEDDLRVRKEIKDDADIDPAKEFLEELGRSVRVLFAFLRQDGSKPSGIHHVERGDARKLPQHWARYKERIHCIITSPPYATALPYLDTDRLSLCYLRLLSRPEHRKADEMMIGNREITRRLRTEYESKFHAQKNRLPGSVSHLIQKIEQLNASHPVGFRRRNLPALLTKYFFDMREVLVGMNDVLREDGRAFVVVGNNHTIAGGQKVDIHTASMLQEIGEQIGFAIEDSIDMEMLTSRDIFRKNTIESERIIAFRKKGQ